MGSIKMQWYKGNRRRKFGLLNDFSTIMSAPGPGLFAKRRPSRLGQDSPEPDLGRTVLKGVQNRRPRNQPKPSMPRMPWNDKED